MSGLRPPTGPEAPVSPDGRWWWDGSRWMPMMAPSGTPWEPVRPGAPVSPDGRWWWDGSRWMPRAAPSRRLTRGSIVVHVAMGLAMLGGYAAVMFLIGIADGRQSGYVFGVTDALVLASVGVIPALVGLIAYFRLPRRNALRIEALFAIAVGLAVAGGLILLMFL